MEGFNMNLAEYYHPNALFEYADLVIHTNKNTIVKDRDGNNGYIVKDGVIYIMPIDRLNTIAKRAYEKTI